MKPQTRTLLFILLSFLLGIVGGLVVGRNYYGQASRPRPSREEIRKEFTERLRLDNQQRALVDSILEGHRRKFGETRKQYSELIRTQRDSLRLEIRKLLNPEQNKLYDEYLKEMEEREAKERERRER